MCRLRCICIKRGEKCELDRCCIILYIPGIGLVRGNHRELQDLATRHGQTTLLIHRHTSTLLRINATRTVIYMFASPSSQRRSHASLQGLPAPSKITIEKERAMTGRRHQSYNLALSRFNPSHPSTKYFH